MILKELEYISEIAKYENLSTAARNLSVTQSALSLSLANLERELGIMLFAREKNRLKITAEGLIYVETAREMLKIRNDLYKRLQSLKNRPQLHIGLASAYSFQIFARVLADNKKLYSTADISVSEGRASPLLSQLERGILDLIIIAKDKLLDLPDCSVRLIRQEPFALYMSPQHPLTKDPRFAVPVGMRPPQVDFSIFKDEPFILSPKDTSDGAVALNILDEYISDYHIYCNINNTSSIMEMVRRQIGLTIMPIPAGYHNSCNELYWCVPQKHFYRYVQLIYHCTHALSPLEESLINDIQRAYDSEHMDELY